MTIEEQQFRGQIRVLLRDLITELRKLNDKLDIITKNN